VHRLDTACCDDTIGGTFANRQDQVDGHSRLERMEQALRVCMLWLRLGLRFESFYGHGEGVLALRSALNDGIERPLKGGRPLAQMRHARPQRRRLRAWVDRSTGFAAVRPAPSRSRFDAP
jgi:hypothetical protein